MMYAVSDCRIRANPVPNGNPAAMGTKGEIGGWEVLIREDNQERVLKPAIMHDAHHANQNKPRGSSMAPTIALYKRLHEFDNSVHFSRVSL